jgi:hypothetical protein
MIHAGDDDFWFAGQGITVTFRSADSVRKACGNQVADSMVTRLIRVGTSDCCRGRSRSGRCDGIDIVDRAS